MSEEALEWSYREELDEKLMAYLAEMKDLSLKKAMDLYFPVLHIFILKNDFEG